MLLSDGVRSVWSRTLDIPDDFMTRPALATLLSMTADTILLTNVCISNLLPYVRTALTYRSISGSHF
jgi:hypothetical protein